MWLKKVKGFLNDVEIERLRLAAFQVVAPGTQISISEVNCPEPNCPPIKTVIMIFEPGQPARSITLHKPIGKVTNSEAQSAVRAVGSRDGIAG
jgi:hypothetical protein